MLPGDRLQMSRLMTKRKTAGLSPEELGECRRLMAEYRRWVRQRPGQRERDRLACRRARERALADPAKAAKLKDNTRRWREANGDCLDMDRRRRLRRERKKQRYHSEPCFRLANNIRSRVANAVRDRRYTKPKAGSSTALLGCTYEELRVYLEKLFLPGMTWDNQGEWHIDHKVPLSCLDLTDPEQFSKAVHYTNLQPLWARDNYAKSNKLDWDLR